MAGPEGGEKGVVYLVPPSGRDEQAYLAGVQAMVSMGVRVSKDAVLERLGIQEAGEGEEFLTAARPPVIGQESLVTGEESGVTGHGSRVTGEESLANSSSSPMTHQPMTRDMQAIRSALAKDLQPLGDALFSAYQAGDLAAMQAALKKISKDLPDLSGDAAALSTELAGQFTTAYLGEGAEEVANGGTGDGAVKGWETRRANGWVPAPRLLTPQEADAELEKGFFVANQSGETIRFGAELKKKLDDKVLNDADRNARKQRLRWAKLAVAEGSHETSRKHGSIRTVYAKTYRRGPKYQDVEVIVDTINGYAWNIMVKGGSPNAVR